MCLGFEDEISQRNIQILNIVADLNGVYIPILHVFMTSRKKVLYRAVFRNIRANFPNLNWTHAMMDFETGNCN